MRRIILFVVLSILLLGNLSIIKAEEMTDHKVNKPYTVVVVIEAISGKEKDLQKALMEVIEPSRKEVTCLEYRVYQDINNPVQFVLYENWVSKEAHQLQFTKPYILTFVEKAGALLAKPYQVVFAQEL